MLTKWSDRRKQVLPDVYVAKNYDMEKGLLNELVLQYY